MARSADAAGSYPQAVAVTAAVSRSTERNPIMASKDEKTYAKLASRADSKTISVRQHRRKEDARSAIGEKRARQIDNSAGKH
jgi:hypothetical protein